MKKFFLSAVVMAAMLIFGHIETRAETTECTEITSLPATITVQGVYCLKSDQSTNITNGSAITINTNNVTIDLNGWKLGGLAAGTGTFANGIYALDRKNITIRNGTIRGFSSAIHIDGMSDTSSGHLIEHILADSNRYIGFQLEGSNLRVLNNSIINTGPHDLFTVAYGMFINSAPNSYIHGNTVSVVDESLQAIGLRFTGADRSVIINNRVLDLKNGSNVVAGIQLLTSSRVFLNGNVLSTGGNGTLALSISTNSENITCIDNAAHGFVSGFTSCDVDTGNVLN
ncbi:MAG: hypothetical protein QNJ29_07205 [Rhizobiaceae bacterium]|nr:hypothetical protein [Rhizobiaceae bacterium]